MDRRIVYAGSIPLDTDLLFAQRSAMVGVGTLAQAALSLGTYVDGLACAPTVPASMTVSVGPGMITQPSTLDATAYGSLQASTSPLTKVGVNLLSTPFAFTAPGAPGQSQAFLIQAQFSEVDGDPVALPYLNAANPAISFSGPANSGAPQNTTRQQRVGLQVKAGIPATTGYQVMPSADAGWSPLWVITIPNGATSLTTANIAQSASGPFLRHRVVQLSNQLQTVISAAGLTLDVTNDGQTLAALRALFGGMASRWNYVIANQNIQAPAWANGIQWELVGGGGGGGASGTTGGGGGGGAGGESLGWAAVSPGQVLYCIVGQGGLNGATPTAQAQPGGTTSLALLASATGGGGGIGGDNTSNQGLQGGGGTGYGGALNLVGGSGNQGGASVNAASGIGGSSRWGHGGASTKLSALGDNGSGYGSGGGGSFGGNGPGGNGQPGLIAYRWTA